MRYMDTTTKEIDQALEDIITRALFVIDEDPNGLLKIEKALKYVRDHG